VDFNSHGFDKLKFPFLKLLAEILCIYHNIYNSYSSNFVVYTNHNDLLYSLLCKLLAFTMIIYSLLADI